MYNLRKIEQITPGLTLFHYNDIPVLHLEHAVGSAKISLQGAQLLSWQPANSKHDILWLSQIEPFKLGSAIRGGVPICYPWFNQMLGKTPAHGTARLRLWTLQQYQITSNSVELTLALFEEQQLKATMQMTFNQKCMLTFTHYGNTPAQLALHSYFNVGNIQKTKISPLPTACFNFLTQQKENVPTIRTISENIDCLYEAEIESQMIADADWGRNIRVTHHNASDIVLWNPWHKATSAMQPTDYQQMLCLETARISRLLTQEEQLSVELNIE